MGQSCCWIWDIVAVCCCSLREYDQTSSEKGRGVYTRQGLPINKSASTHSTHITAANRKIRWFFGPKLASVSSLWHYILVCIILCTVTQITLRLRVWSCYLCFDRKGFCSGMDAAPSWDYLISQWLTMILPTNEKSDSLKRKPLNYGAQQVRINHSSLI